MPFRYSAFGESLESDILLPELPLAHSRPEGRSCHVCGTTDEDIPTTSRVLGVISHLPCRPTLSDAGTFGFVFDHQCTGRFLVARDGASIRYASVLDVSLDRLRNDILGRVMAIALHLQGNYALHASAVVAADGAIGFLAPKGSGKSTLALAMASAGAPLVTDDMLVVVPDRRPSVRRGIQSMRLHHDSSALLGSAAYSAREGVDGKRVIDDIPVARMDRDRAPLSALYILDASDASDLGSDVTRRTLLAPRLATMALIREAKVGSLLGGAQASVLFERAAAIAHSTPVYSLAIRREFACLSAVVRTITDWHSGTVRVAS